MGMKSWIFIITAFFFSFVSAGVSNAKITIKLDVDKASYAGTCPASVNFKGTITSDKPGKIQYRFIRSDGVLQPVETLEFGIPETKEIESKWTAGNTKTPLFEGWQSLKIVYPEEIESEKVFFKAACDIKSTDLKIKVKNCPKSAKAGHEIGSSVKVITFNQGASDVKDVAIDFALRKESACPVSGQYPTYSPNYFNGVLLKGSHEQISLNAGQKQEFKIGGSFLIPADTPAGDYFLCAIIDAGDKVKETNKTNNCSCCPIKITSPIGRPDLTIERFAFKGWGKCEPNQPIFNFEVTVANKGSAPSPALPNKVMVQVMDMHGSGWGNGTGLNSIPPGGSQTVVIPVYYFSQDPGHMTKVVPHPFRAVVDPLHLVGETNPRNNRSDIIYLDPGLVCPK